MSKLRSMFVFVLAMVLVTPFAPLSLKASESIKVLNENFSSLKLMPAPEGEWWAINSGVDEFGWPSRVVGGCSDATCINEVQEGSDKFVRLTQYATEVPGYYYNADLAELNTGFAYGEPTRWTPVVGHPVEVVARARWSENYSADGASGAIGSTGIWLWNSPVDIPNYTFHEFSAIGLNYQPYDSVMAPGLNYGTYALNWPMSMQPIQVDMSVWNEFKFVWSADEAGNQAVEFFVNGASVGVTPLYVPLDNLSVEIWNDNQKMTWEGPVVEPPTAQQDFEVNYIRVEKL